jgi:hypothetical protein
MAYLKVLLNASIWMMVCLRAAGAAALALKQQLNFHIREGDVGLKTKIL